MNRERESRNRSRRRDAEHRRRRARERRSSQTPDLPHCGTTLLPSLNQIISRLSALENNQAGSVGNSDVNNDGLFMLTGKPTPKVPTPIVSQNDESTSQVRPNEPSVDTLQVLNDVSGVSQTGCNSSSVRLERDTETMSDSTRLLADAIKSCLLGSSRSQNYFVSNFDPAIHNIDVWCSEVERARVVNNWLDSECLSRVSSCLRGDARTWLNEWVTNDRTWSNFVREFKPLCPRKLDYANILYEAMTNTSDKYPIYAEYARRTLLRLLKVEGLSPELRVLIVIRGITDPQVRAAAANAQLTSEDLVSFLAIYNKPARTKMNDRPTPNNKRPFLHQSNHLKCFSCGQTGHKYFHCPKKSRLDHNTPTRKPEQNKEPNLNKSNTCSFCKKPGHDESTCFAKERSQFRNTQNVSLCAERTLVDARNNDVITAVIQGVPVDVLIDSGALNISLISADVLKHFSSQLKPTQCTLKGISDVTVEAYNYFVTLTVEFDEISIEADFTVVPGSCMSFPVIVGTDILNRDGVTYVRTKDKQYLTHSSKVAALINAIAADESGKINTPLLGPERESLLTVIKDFRDYLISGTANTTVTTGKMHINLTNNTPVAYRPYKLSYQEKLKVREIVRDLMD